MTEMTELNGLKCHWFTTGSKQLKGKQANSSCEIALYGQFWFLDFGFTTTSAIGYVLEGLVVH